MTWGGRTTVHQRGNPLTRWGGGDKFAVNQYRSGLKISGHQCLVNRLTGNYLRVSPSLAKLDTSELVPLIWCGIFRSSF